ncbi:MAG: flavin reductase family protein [Pseudomonadota bacterium]
MKQQFLDAMSKAANSVTVVTTDGPAGKVGVTVSAMCSVSVEDPAPTILVCIHKDSPACEAIRQNAAFCANLLGEDQTHISDSFAGRLEAKGEQKFDCATWKKLATGVPVLDGALAAFDCMLLHEHLVRSHRIFIGAIQCVESADAGKPLLYHDRRYGRTEALGL